MDNLREEFGSLASRVHCRYRAIRRIDTLRHDEAMSFLQKCGRRGMEKEGLRVLFGGLSLMLDDECHRPSITNIVNRILIMLVEDCLGQPYIYVVARDLYRDFCHKKDLGTKEAIGAIVHMFALVLGTTKGRMASIARLIKDACSGKYSEELCVKYKEEIALPLSMEALPPIGKFNSLVKAGDLRNVTLLDQINDARLVWKGLKLVLDEDPSVPGPSRETIDALEDLYKLKNGHAERELFLYHAIVLVTFRKNVTSWTDCPRVSESMSDEALVLQEFRNYLSTIDDEEARKFSVPAYCIDVHTFRGKAAGKDAVAFASEGAGVTNADGSVVPPALAARYAEMYIASKTAIVLSAVESKRKEPSPPISPSVYILDPDGNGTLAHSGEMAKTTTAKGK